MTLDTVLLARALRSRRTAQLVARTLDTDRKARDRADASWLLVWRRLVPLLAAFAKTGDVAPFLDNPGDIARATTVALGLQDWQLLAVESTTELVAAWNAGEGTGWQPTPPKVARKPHPAAWSHGLAEVAS